MTEEEELENTRKLILKEHEPVWYHSVLDPEAKVIVNFDTGQIKIRDKKLWEAYVSNTWIKG